MASLQELSDVVRETLENRGVLNQLRAQVRAEVFSALDDPTDSMPNVSRENMLINELIRDYMEYNHYKYSLSVFSSETRLPPEKLDRQFLAQELNILEDRASAAVPLLYSIVSHFASNPAIGQQSSGEVLSGSSYN